MRYASLVAGLLLALPMGAAGETACPAHRDVPVASATYYEPAAIGACSLPTPPGAYYAAIALPDYDGSEACGRCVRITGPEASITAQIVDVCISNECVANHLDLLGRDTFDAIGNPDDGNIAISWETVACDVGEGTMKLAFEGSNPYYLKVQVQEHRYGIATVEMQDGATWVAMTRTFDNHFERSDARAPYPEPLHFRITDLHGQSVESDGVALMNGIPLDTGVQLEPCPEPASALAAVAAVGVLWFLHRRLGEGAARRRLATREAGHSASTDALRFVIVQGVVDRTIASSSAP